MSTSNKWDMVHSAAAVLFAALFALVLIAAREAVPSANPAEDPDTQFALNAAAGGMSEVKLGTLAAADALAAKPISPIRGASSAGRCNTI
jgi:hypothetical protein